MENFLVRCMNSNKAMRHFLVLLFSCHLLSRWVASVIYRNWISRGRNWDIFSIHSPPLPLKKDSLITEWHRNRRPPGVAFNCTSSSPWDGTFIFPALGNFPISSWCLASVPPLPKSWQSTGVQMIGRLPIVCGMSLSRWSDISCRQKLLW